MPPAAGRNLAPRSFLAENESWPFGDLRPGSPPYARYAQTLARRVQDLRADHSLSERDVATLVGVPNNTLSRVLRGDAVPDLVTIALLETGLRTRLLPDPAEGDEASGEAAGAALGHTSTM